MLATTIAGIPLENCIYNASGPRTGSIEALVKIGKSKAGAVLSKSATLEKQDGNPLPRSINKVSLGESYCEGSINSEGLPNYGIDYYIEAEGIKEIHKHGKPYIVSLSGLSLEDNLIMLSRVYETEGIAAIELNLACPNVPGKPMIAYDFIQMDTVLKAVCSHPSFGKIPLGVKLAPYLDIPLFEQVIGILLKYPIKYIVCINTIGNALFVDTENECEAIVPRQGLGGLGGGFVKHTALANVRIFYNLLQKYQRTDIDIIGVGGVNSGKDVFELILCGAKAVQVGTCHWTEGSTCFLRITEELETIMKSKGYHSIEDFRGKLKSYVAPAKKASPVATPTVASEVKGNEEIGKKTHSGTFDEKIFNPLTATLVGIIALLLMKIIWS